VGTMVELPRAALQAGRLAEQAEFFSFGTNDLTQTTYGLSRDDAGAFLPEYKAKGIVEQDPFVSLDQEGVGELIQIAVERGRRSRSGMKMGICGEHGGDPASIEFCEKTWLDYVSCSPFRVPIARLAAAQAALKSQGEKALQASTKAKDGARVIAVSSTAHLGANKELMTGAYCQSKLANVLFAKELDRKFKKAFHALLSKLMYFMQFSTLATRTEEAGINATAVSCHPGGVDTDLQRWTVTADGDPQKATQLRKDTPAADAFISFVTRSVQLGANTQIFLAAGADGGYSKSGGEYFDNMAPGACAPCSLVVRVRNEEVGVKTREDPAPATSVDFLPQSQYILKPRRSANTSDHVLLIPFEHVLLA
ncbi:Pyruvate, phosphate dikinase, partial [Symbiodinium microadriaticum]